MKRPIACKITSRLGKVGLLIRSLNVCVHSELWHTYQLSLKTPAYRTSLNAIGAGVKAPNFFAYSYERRALEGVNQP